MKMKGTEGKYIFKKSLESHLSNDILYRKKMGFGVPLASWFRGPLKDKVNNITSSEKLLDTGIFNEKFLNHLVSQHQIGVRDYSTPIWTLLMFESFLQRLDV